ncbi:hypothetical protein HK104_005971 [Borealophlyctis nickersoniae]|nr:hypothetical protein HK104_005971 [Borealophlyctis nickersoniae]
MPALEIPGLADTNIWLAAGEGRVEVVEHFLNHGAPGGGPLDPNIKDDHGYTPLHAASAYSHPQLIILLIQKFGADPNITDDEGDTPLHVVETAEAARCLVDLGADPTMRNTEGRLPIEVAAEEEFDEVVEYLKEFTPEYIHNVNVELNFSHMESDEDGEGESDSGDDTNVANAEDTSTSSPEDSGSARKEE